ncbi:MAG: NTP transferase domain-containing protein [Anaerolineae bacterium]|nr:NTP transferase domain-containing protein [Anaerolineae bacterium]
MKVIIPLAGFGTRLRPLTYSRPKPLVNVAGKPILGHLLDKLKVLPVEEYIFITGYLGDQIQAYVSQNYGETPARYFEQKELNGQSPAIYLAREAISGPVIILFVDTIFEGDISFLATTDADAYAFVKEVDDPRRFGVAAVNSEGIVHQFIEKPDTLDNRLAVIGMYYIRDSAAMLDAIRTQLEEGRKTKGEYYLADAFQIMVDRGTKFRVAEVEEWLDAGTSQALLETNRLLLERGRDNIAAINAEGFVIIPPVYIHPTARITNSVIGPYVTLGKNCRVENCIIRDSIVDADTVLENILISGSLVGQNVEVKGAFRSINVGDSTSLRYE